MSLSADQLLEDDTFLFIGRRILTGNCALFLGAGSSLSSGAPTSEELATLIATKVLMTDKTYPLAEVVAYADASVGRRQVCEVIADRLAGLEPATALKLLPAFRWKTIFSVNFDDLIAKAYAQTKDTRAAELSVFYAAADLDFVPAGHIPLYMVHGDFRHPTDPKMGLVLTADDFVKATSHRRAFYRLLTDKLQRDEVVYAGFSLSDPDFHAVVNDVWEAVDQQPNLVPRGYALQPDYELFAQRHWDSKKITLIDATIEDFAGALMRLASGKETQQPIEIGSRPILPDFLSSISVVSDLSEDISNAFDFPQFDAGESTAAQFFRGGPVSWADIRERIDGMREVTDGILETVLIDPSEEPTRRSAKSTPFVFVDGPAGTGKTTLLRRLAWELAHTWRRPVAWIRDPSLMQFDLIEAMAKDTDGRLYLFIDNCADAGRQVIYVLNRCRRRNLAVSFIGSDRANEWSASTKATPLDPDYRITLGSITRVEAIDILAGMRRTDQLGTLKDLPEEDQLSRLLDRAGRQLLVALREATEEGRRFDEIIEDEYGKIPSETAKRAYLYVCTLYQFGIVTRAGILSRATGVALGDFAEKVLHPTDSVIVERQINVSAQPTYQARHEVIAQIVFRRALPTSRTRADQILAILNQLDPGYRDDHMAFSRLINYRWLRQLGLTPGDLSDVYNAAKRLRPDDHRVTHQQALSLRFADPGQAARLLREAEEMEPRDDLVRHSRATLMLDQARDLHGEERHRLLLQAEGEFRGLMRADPTNAAPYASLAKLYLDESIAASDNAERIRFLAMGQHTIRDAYTRCRVTQHLLEMTARLDEAVGQFDDAEEDYRQAIAQAAGDVQLASNFAAFLRRLGRETDAVAVLNSALDMHPADPLLNYSLARLLEIVEPDNEAAIRRAYECAIAEPVRGFMPQLDYAVYLFLVGDQGSAYQHFRELRSLDLSYSVRARPYRWLEKDGARQVFPARLWSRGLSSSFIEVAIFQEPVYISPTELAKGTSDSEFSVNVSFNLFGPRAFLAERES